MKARYYVGRHVCSDTPTKWFAVFDRHADTTDARFIPCCLRKSKKACETFIAGLKREAKTERQFNRRRRQRLARLELHFS